MQRQIKQIVDSFTLGSVLMEEAESQLDQLRSSPEGK